MKWTNLFLKELAHDGEMAVREIMDFSGRFAGVGTRLEMLAELSRWENDQGIKPDAEPDAFMKATAVSGHESRLVTEYVLRIPGLCPEIQNTPTKLAKTSTSITTKTN